MRQGYGPRERTSDRKLVSDRGSSPVSIDVCVAESRFVSLLGDCFCIIDSRWHILQDSVRDTII